VDGDPEVVVAFASAEELEAELGNLLAGAAFARGGATLEERSPCTAVIEHPLGGEALRLPALVVWTCEAGLGLVFREFDSEVAERIRSFVAVDGSASTESPARGARPTRPPARETQPPASDVNARVRNLSISEQVQLARRGDQMERAALERAYGKTVWEALLRNPKITQPEVARIARKGALPRILIELILDTPGWLTSAQVRRALLGNRKLSGDMITKVLRATPRAELKLMPKQTAYPPAVREAAHRLLHGDGG